MKQIGLLMMLLAFSVMAVAQNGTQVYDSVLAKKYLKVAKSIEKKNL